MKEVKDLNKALSEWLSKEVGRNVSLILANGRLLTGQVKYSNDNHTAIKGTDSTSGIHSEWIIETDQIIGFGYA